MLLRVRIFSKNKSMSVWIFKFERIFETSFDRYIFVFIFLKKNIYYLFILLPEAAVLQ